jgi:hypothetical protein
MTQSKNPGQFIWNFIADFSTIKKINYGNTTKYHQVPLVRIVSIPARRIRQTTLNPQGNPQIYSSSKVLRGQP